MDKSVLERAREVFDTEVEGIIALKNNLGAEFEQLADRCAATVRNGGKIIISGIGKSGYIGKKIAATLSSVGSPAVFMHPVEALHGDLGIIQKNDLLIALSYSGETEELLVVLNPAKRLGMQLVAITGNPESTLAEMSDLTVPMPVPREACPFNLAPTTSTTALLVLGDALAMTLLDMCGFTQTEYGRLHPGGAIGRMVTMKASDLMRGLDRSALVSPGATIRETIIAMSGARCGSAMVVDDEKHLLGIFTDGDFRRMAEKYPNVLEMKVDEAMTANPVTVNGDVLAAQVLKLLEERHVDDLVVTDNNKHVLGFIDTQDLPGLKVM